MAQRKEVSLEALRSAVVSPAALSLARSVRRTFRVPPSSSRPASAMRIGYDSPEARGARRADSERSPPAFRYGGSFPAHERWPHL